MPKVSRFNSYIAMPAGQTAVYNTYSGRFCIIQDSVARQLSRLARHGGRIPQLVVEALPALKHSGVLIDDERDELEEYRSRCRGVKYGAVDARFLLYTAATCNFQCPYCYQARLRQKREGLMDEPTAHRVIRFMQRVIAENHCRRVTVGIYGGEPLLNPRISGMIMSDMMGYCGARDILIQYSLTTNCYHVADLRDEAVVGLATAINTVLDGPPDLHNQVRCTRSGRPSYAKVMAGIRAALTLDKILGIRVHYDNIDGRGLLRILDDLMTAGVDCSKRVSIYLMNIEEVPEIGPQACRYKTDPETLGQRMRHVRELAEAIEGHPLRPLFNWEYTCPDQPLPQVYACGFDRIMSFAVDFEGSLRKCCGFVGEALLTGTLGDSGEPVWTGSHFAILATEVAERQVCRQCVYLPVCGGGCVLNEQPPKTLDDCRNLRNLFHQKITSYVESCVREHRVSRVQAGHR